MRLIADSGSTKTDWVLIDGADVCGRFQTQGINPFHQSEDDMKAILLNELLPQLSFTVSSPLTVSFYGSGVRPELQSPMEQLLQQSLPSVTSVEAYGDLLGAARAVCGAAEGIACILGTGANSGLYDGVRIVANTPPLGYILGDEGSGAVLGARFLNALYKGFMPQLLVAEFQCDMNLTMADVVACVYRQPMANRFLASLSPFIHRHLDMPEVRQLVVGCLRDFFSRNVRQYQRPDLPVGFVGSIACAYEDCLREAAALEGFIVGRVMKSPMEGLIVYHRH
jgi:N-acetylglucosamine kinase-like BadF-type ATPase